VLRRALEFFGYRVRHVINITDVGHLTSDGDTGEDKIEKGARRAGKSAWEIAQLYTFAFQDDLRQLNVLEPTLWCRATDHIAEQIRDIETIERRGFTYRTSDGIYFDTSKLPSYGKLARLDVAGLAAGARVALGEKRRATDFALWKFSPPDQMRQMEWDSPWGIGFPGWHIECSAMAVEYLGRKFDIHCGGKDHIPVHHCNEIAQAEVCHGSTLANFWMHGYFLEVEQSKMSKSDGEFLRLKRLTERGYDPLDYRYLCLTAHYRSDLKFTWESLDAAAAALARLRAQMHSWGDADDGDDRDADADDGDNDDDGGDGDNDDDDDQATAPDEATAAAFRAQIGDDLNTAKGLAVLWRLAKSDLAPPIKRATALHLDRVLGLDLANWRPHQIEVPDEVAELMRRRAHARHSHDWAEADRLRNEIHARGYEIDDSTNSSTISRRRTS
ncbi:MAG: CysS/YqeB C-terminal domain-containing protein, partial [bacterium]